MTKYKFDRYINGKIMAQGVTIDLDVDLERAMRVAANVANRGPKGETPVLIYIPQEEPTQ